MAEWDAAVLEMNSDWCSCSESLEPSAISFLERFNFESKKKCRIKPLKKTSALLLPSCTVNILSICESHTANFRRDKDFNAC